MKKIILFMVPLFYCSHAVPMDFLGSILINSLINSYTRPKADNFLTQSVLEQMVDNGTGIPYSNRTIDSALNTLNERQNPGSGFINSLGEAAVREVTSRVVSYSFYQAGNGFNYTTDYLFGSRISSQSSAEATPKEKKPHFQEVIFREYLLMFGEEAPEDLISLSTSKLQALAIAEEQANTKGLIQCTYFRNRYAVVLEQNGRNVYAEEDDDSNY